MADFDPASEPLGSPSPLVRDLNTRNLDRGVNSEEMTWVDRFGVEHPTFHGMKQELNGILIAGGRIFDSEAQGRAVAGDGQYYYAASDNPNISKSLWKRINSTTSQHIADDPSSDFVDGIAQSAASIPQHSKLISAFHKAPASPKDVAFAIQSLFSSPIKIRQDGKLINDWLGVFHREESPPCYALTAENGKPIIKIDTLGNLLLAIAGDTLKDLPRNYGAVLEGGAYIDTGYVRVASPETTYITPNPTIAFQEASQIYELFDALVDECPDYFSMRVLGMDDFGNEIRAYTASPAGYHERWFKSPRPDILTHPEFLLFGCVHGGEKYTAFNLYRLFKRMAANWKDDPRAQALRWGVKFDVIPIVNPSGFNANSRYNGNGVDINRNFPFGWAETTSEFRGPSPESEAETRIVMDFLRAHDSAKVVIDHHNAGSILNDEAFAFWLATDDEKFLPPLLKSLNHMNAYIREEFSYVDQANVPFVRLTNHWEATLSEQAQSMGFNSYLFEAGSGLKNNVDRQIFEFEGLLTLLSETYAFETNIRTGDLYYATRS